jgi:starch synthase
MLAAENGALAGGKVGGMGDVIRDLPLALARPGHEVTVVTPAYGFLARLPGILERGSLSVPFAGATEACRWLELPSGIERVHYYLLDHARFAPRGIERIYHDDRDDGPFATDATKFAFFSAAGAELVRSLAAVPDVVHLHDWHPSLYLLLRQCDPAYRALKDIRTVLTIHNLALQGIRPLDQADSSLHRWFPALQAPPEIVGDPRYPNCINPLAAAIRLADTVSTVSPSYAREIVTAPDPATGHRGGEGLEAMLAERQRDQALVGILNGCEYPAARAAPPEWPALVAVLHDELMHWIAAGSLVDTASWLADKRLTALPQQRPSFVATSIGRVTEQKLGLFRAPLDGRTVLDAILTTLDDGLLIMLGSGDADYEAFLQQTMAQHENFLFLRGYSDQLSETLYAGGDVFLMPSLFEPCGISQMLAMRAGQPCVVHAVGGLQDTVSAKTGFPFNGGTPEQQAEQFLAAVARAAELKRAHPDEWRRLAAAAAEQRFTWDVSAARYLDEVYGFDAPST